MKAQMRSLVGAVAVGSLVAMTQTAHAASATLADGVLDGAIRGGIIGGAVGGIVGAMMYFVKKKKPKPGTCPKCGYDLRGSSGMCPECGAAAPHNAERDRSR